MFLKLLFIVSIVSSFIFTHFCMSQCLDHEKNLLLQLKNELIFDYSFSTKLVEWNHTNNCCHWYGVECDGAGHVISLQLDDEFISSGIGDSSSLFRLKHLEKLNLANSWIDYDTPIPRGIGNLTYLTHLNLSYVGFRGQVPLEISFLSRLVSLDISVNYELSLNLSMLLQNRTGLKELHLDSVNITSSRERENWSQIISSYLPNITTLSLAYCDLTGPVARSFGKLHSLSVLRLDSNDLSTARPNVFANFPSLTTLSLVGCNLKGYFPNKIFQIPTLQHLDLTDNRLLSGGLPPFPQNGSLKSIRLGYTNFSGLIPTSIANLKSLLEIDLSNCKFRGPIPPSFANLTQLTYVDLSSNFRGKLLSGTFQLDKIIQSFPNLTLLNLSNNNLSVHLGNKNSSRFRLVKLEVLFLASCNLYDFPHFIKHSDRMRKLDLSNNGISGEIPSWIWGPQLERLYLSFNNLIHMQKPYHIPPSLKYLDLQSNQLREELHLPFRHDAAPNLYYLSLGNNSLSGSIPTSLCTATQLEALDLSMNKLSGTIPSCLLDGTINLKILDLGRNNISGHIPDNCTPSSLMEYFDVNNNTIEGKIPKSIERCERLQLMNVGNNIINDTFPCMLSSSLRVLVLRSNRFHGEVKCYNSSWKELQIIDISRNNFSGSLQSLNFSSWRAMDVGLDGQFGKYYELSYNTSLVPKVGGVRITMKGLEIELLKIYPDFTAIDFSCNNFRGELPKAIGDLSSLRLLNFSHNALNGSIPKSFGKLGELESLDLSRNKLTGQVPMELSHLTFLSVLNLSYNELVGEIPKGKQLQTFPADSFLGNPGLCGFNLNISCLRATEDGSDEKDEEKKKQEIEWEYVSAALGYAVGLGSFVWLLLFCRSFRYKYFGKIDEIVEDIFDARDRRTRKRSHARRVERNRVVRRH